MTRRGGEWGGTAGIGGTGGAHGNNKSRLWGLWLVGANSFTIFPDFVWENLLSHLIDIFDKG